MWPRVLPRQVRESSLRSAEVKVYDLLADCLDGGWVVFYSRPWLGLTPSGEEKDGECDFVVMHPAFGYLTIEVKGGGISYDPAADQWMSTDRHKIRRKIKYPVQQAVSSKHELLDKVKLIRMWPGRYIRARHGVVFTDTVAPPRMLGPNSPREIFCCRDELADLAGWIKRRLSGGEADQLGAEGIRAFEELLASPFTLRVPLGHYLDDDEQAIESLTPQQFHILDAVGHLTRVAAGGGAGTGKTILAMEDAIRQCRKGLRTGLICRSDPLAAFMRAKLAKVEPSVGVWSIGELCRTLADQAQVAFTASAGIETGIECLISAIHKDRSLSFDAIIVDEAQDFRTHWWIAIEELLSRGGLPCLHAYFDTNQSIYGDLAGELAAFRIVPVHLTRNLRNTRCIHDAASKFYKGIPITADGPEGITVDWQECPAQKISARVVNAAAHLIGEKVAPSDVVILAVDASSRADIRNRSGFPDGVEVSLIEDFKGLERKAVIIAATRGLADKPELAYVSLSRPRTHLAVFGEKDILCWLGMPTDVSTIQA
jgi:hypothetical protein